MLRMVNINFNMERENIIKALERSNPWWKGEFSQSYKPREAYGQIKSFMSSRQIISLTGLRRTGKTTILFKIVQDYLPEFKKENVVYFSFDDFRDVKIQEIIDAYEFLMNEAGKEKVLFLLDEIQKLDGWEEQLKRIYDENRKFKFVISGSESLFLRKGTRESLAGRMFEFQIKKLSFKEYLKFIGRDYDNINLYRKEILSDFRNFLYCNGFPEAVGENEDFVSKYIKENVIEKIIYRDIPQIISLDNPEILYQIFMIISKRPGQEINLDSLAKDVGISRQTASSYLDYLEKSFLIKKLYNFSRNARKTQTRLKKYYPTVMLPEDSLNKELFGLVFESFLANELDADFFWRDVYKNEVDIVLKDKEIIPIEVKVSSSETKPLRLFMEKFKCKKGFILTYDKEEKTSQGIETLPFYKYLLKR